MARKVIAEFDAIDGPFLNKLRAIDAGIARFETGTLSAFGRVEKGMNGLLASAARLQNVSGIIAGGFGAQIATNYIDQATRIRRALKEAGEDSQEAFEKAFLASQRSLSGFEAFAQGAQRMKKATGNSFDDAIRDMETLNKLLVLGGKTTQERMSTMIQFSQALQAGVLQGEELRSLRENAPIELIRAIAREAGGSIEDLKKFGEAGVLTTDVMMRALKSLEAEADLRMKSVTMTIGEATTVLSNAGIVAGEAFDKGLGLSRAAVAGLTGLASILGSNAEAARMFGEAVKYAAVVGLGAFVGGRAASAVSAIRASGDALRQAAVVAEGQYARAVQAQAKAAERARIAIAAVDAAAAKSSTTQARLATLNATSARATATLAAANDRLAVSYAAAEAAQARLTMGARVAAGAMGALKAAFNFLGGIPGILLTAGMVFLTMSANAETAAERIDRLTANTGEAQAAADALRDVQARLSEAMQEAGDTGTESSRRLVAGTQAEYEAKKKLLALEMQRLAQQQFERVNEITGLRDQQNKDREKISGIEGYYNTLPDQEKILQFDGLQAQINALNASISESEGKITRLRAAHEEAARIIGENNVILSQTFDAVGDAAAGAGIPDEALAKFNEMLAIKQQEIAVKQQEIGLQQLIAQYGAESAQVAEYRAAAERAAYEETAKAAGITGELLVQLMAVYDEAVAISGVDMSSGIAAAASSAAALAQNLGVSVALAQRLMQGGYSKEAPVLDPRDPRYDAGAAARANNFGFEYGRVSPFDPSRLGVAKGGSSGGGRRSGGGGGGAANDIDREALQFIESMMTAEEKRAEKLKEITKLRSDLVAKYGEEHEMVQRVDEAMKRMNETMSEGNSLQEQFWGTMSDYIAQSINDWKGWGDFVRGLLASFVQQYGEDFFIALFTPGKQSGDGFGTWLGNALTGQLHSGGGRNDRQARSVSPLAFVGAPRFHKGLLGLKPDEFTAILQDGETVLPKGVGLGGDSVTVVMQNDFRGVDSASRAYLDGKLNELARSIPAQAVAAVKTAKRKRVL